MSYNLTGIENSNNLLETITAVNTLSQGWFITTILIIAWITLFVAFKQYDTLTSLRSSSFIISIASILFYIAGLINIGVMLTPIISTGIFIVIEYLQQN